MPRPARSSPSPRPRVHHRLRRTDRALAWSFLVLLFITGSVLVVIGLHTRAEEQPRAGWITTTGTVIGFHRVSRIRGDDVNRDVVSFSDQAGLQYRITAPAGAGTMGVGTPVRVAYDPRNPSAARDLSGGGWAGPLAAGILMVSLAGLALGFAIRRRLRRRHRMVARGRQSST